MSEEGEDDIPDIESDIPIETPQRSTKRPLSTPEGEPKKRRVQQDNYKSKIIDYLDTRKDKKVCGIHKMQYAASSFRKVPWQPC